MFPSARAGRSCLDSGRSIEASPTIRSNCCLTRCCFPLRRRPESEPQPLVLGFFLRRKLSSQLLRRCELRRAELLSDEIALLGALTIAFGGAQVEPFVCLNVVALDAFSDAIHRA